MKKIMTLGLLAGILAFGTSKVSAQSYEQGTSLLNVGIGIGSTLNASGLDTDVPPLGVSYEYGVNDNISAGGYLGYSAASSESFGYKFNYSYIIIGARGSYHFATSDKLDPYAGILIGYNVASSSVEKPAGSTGPAIAAASAGGFLIGGHLGARYWFTDNIGAFAELGYGIAFLNLGVTAKF